MHELKAGAHLLTHASDGGVAAGGREGLQRAPRTRRDHRLRKAIDALQPRGAPARTSLPACTPLLDPKKRSQQPTCAGPRAGAKVIFSIRAIARASGSHL